MVGTLSISYHHLTAMFLMRDVMEHYQASKVPSSPVHSHYKTFSQMAQTAGGTEDTTVHPRFLLRIVVHW